MEYTANKEAIERASTGGMIDTIGPYEGTFSQAYQVTAQTGTIGIAFDFEDNAGQRARWTLWTHNAHGEEIFGSGHVSSILACMKLRGIKSQPGVAKVYDFDKQAVVDRNVEVYPDLLDKPIGVFLVTEDYERNDGEVGMKMTPAGFFQARTRLVAKEIMERITTPQQYDKIVARLKHRPLRPGSGGSGRSAAAPASQGSPARSSSPRSLEDMDDDIPF